MPAFPFILASMITGAVGGFILEDGVRRQDKKTQVAGATCGVMASGLFAAGVGVAIGNLIRS